MRNSPFKFLFFIVAVAMAITACADARPRHGGIANGSLPAGCPYASGTDASGCAGANASAEFQQANFFTTANEGHTFAAARPARNVAGVDYPVGKITADGSLLDPSGATQPATCTWDGVDNWMNCAGSGTNVLDIHGYNFTGKRVYIHGTYCGTVKIHDNLFDVTTAIPGNADMLRIDESGCAIDFQVYNNKVNGHADDPTIPVLASVFNDTRTNAGSTQFYSYNEWLHISSKVYIQTNSNYAKHYWNYLQWFDFPPNNGAHDEISTQCSANIHCNYDSRYNTTYLPSNTVTQWPNGCPTPTSPGCPSPNLGGGPTTIDYASNGLGVQQYDDAKMIGNVIITQPGTVTAQTALTDALLDFPEVSYTTATAKDNWMFPIGALDCIISSGPGNTTFGTLTMSGNIDAYDGSSVNTIDTPRCAGHQ